MLIAARARLLSPREGPSIEPLALDIITKARSSDLEVGADDPLCVWFTPASSSIFRRIEAAIHQLLIGSSRSRCGEVREDVAQFSDLAAFYYVALFRTVRDLMSRFVPSNPTWTKRPASPMHRLRPGNDKVLRTFYGHILEMASSLDQGLQVVDRSASDILLLLSDSGNVPLENGSVDFVLSSPPYCTRIDYAVATMPELAVLGFHPDGELRVLRRQLIGSSTVPSHDVEPNAAWGDKCSTFLSRVALHPSKASSGYYYKNHVQYFSMMYQSLREVMRVLSSGGLCALVVQDSYYKDIHNDLPAIFQEMLLGLGMLSERRLDFPIRQLMANINSRARRYRASATAVESVLVMRKNS